MRACKRTNGGLLNRPSKLRITVRAELLITVCSSRSKLNRDGIELRACLLTTWRVANCRDMHSAPVIYNPSEYISMKIFETIVDVYYYSVIHPSIQPRWWEGVGYRLIAIMA